MKYDNISPAVFIKRPNRFIAHILHKGREEICHVKNTGRCRELLTDRAHILVQRAANPARKTAYDLISVYKGERLINMDSYAPNIVFGEFLRQGGLGFIPELVRAERSWGNSRFDYYYERNGQAAFVEVKGVTLEEDDVARFPDAPTERGAKHLKELIGCINEGYEAYVVFVIQMAGIKHFEPNLRTDPEFAKALSEAHRAGVKVMAYECSVSENEMFITKSVPVIL